MQRRNVVGSESRRTREEEKKEKKNREKGKGKGKEERKPEKETKRTEHKPTEEEEEGEKKLVIIAFNDLPNCLRLIDFSSIRNFHENAVTKHLHFVIMCMVAHRM